MPSQETSVLPRSHQGQGAPLYFARAQYHEPYPSIYPYSDRRGEGHTPLASQPKRLLPANDDDLQDENNTDIHLVTPTPKKIKTSSTPSEESYSRKSKSLGLLCENFCKCDWSAGIIGIDEAAKLLGVERRRIYDIINILESLDVVRRMCKNRYEWLGFARLPKVMADIQQEGICGCRGLAEEARRWGVIGRDEIVESVSTKGPAKKSLGRLSRQYLQLFLVGNEVMSLTDASDRIMGKAEEPDDIDDPMERKAAVTKGQKTKIRRLYDIANVLASIGLVEKADGERRTRPTFAWAYNWTPWEIRELMVNGNLSSVTQQDGRNSAATAGRESLSPLDKNKNVLAHIHEHGAREPVSQDRTTSHDRENVLLQVHEHGAREPVSHERNTSHDREDTSQNYK